MSGQKPLPSISTTWEEGRYFDRWMVVHFLSGASGAFSNVFFDLSTAGVCSLGVALLVAWEGIELFRGIRESIENRMIDLVVGLLGILAALGVAARLEPKGEYVAFGLTTSAFLAGSFVGWRAYRRRIAGRTPR